MPNRYPATDCRGGRYGHVTGAPPGTFPGRRRRRRRHRTYGPLPVNARLCGGTVPNAPSSPRRARSSSSASSTSFMEWAERQKIPRNHIGLISPPGNGYNCSMAPDSLANRWSVGLRVRARGGHARGVGMCGPLSDWPAFAASWDHLELDPYLAGHGRYRRRRFAVYAIGANGRIERQAHQPHYQGQEYNQLFGGVERWFAPIAEEFPRPRRWRQSCTGAIVSSSRPRPRAPRPLWAGTAGTSRCISSASRPAPRRRASDA